MSEHLDDMARIYSEKLWSLYELLDRSLDPRGPDLLHEIAVEYVSAGSLVLDAGCRDAEHLIRLVRGTDASGVGLDPIAWHIERAQAAVAAHHVADRVEILRGVMQELPFGNDHFDFIWCRDVLEQVDELESALREAARVLRPDGRMLVYTVFATDQLSPSEAEMLSRHLGNVSANLVQSHVEQAFCDAGLVVERQEVIGTEWREYGEERTKPVSRALLRLARLRRQQQAVIRVYGTDIYNHVAANLHWELYQFLGKLQPILYILRGTTPSRGTRSGAATALTYRPAACRCSVNAGGSLVANLMGNP